MEKDRVLFYQSGSFSCLSPAQHNVT